MKMPKILENDIQPLPYERPRAKPRSDLYQVHFHYFDDSVVYISHGPMLAFALLFEGVAMLCRPWLWKTPPRR